MPDLPGWDSLAAVTRYHQWAEVIGIVVLGLLVIAEVVSYQYGQRKDDLTTKQQEATDQRHDEEVARLHRETAALTADAEKAKAEIAQANATAATAALELEKLKQKQAPWQFGDKERALFSDALRSQPRGKILIAYTSADGTRASDFSDALNRVLKTDLGFDVWGYIGPFTSAGPRPATGIGIEMTDASTRPLRDALGNAFQTIGITPNLTRGGGLSAEPGQVIILVGIKPDGP